MLLFWISGAHIVNTPIESDTQCCNLSRFSME